MPAEQRPRRQIDAGTATIVAAVIVGVAGVGGAYLQRSTQVVGASPTSKTTESASGQPSSRNLTSPATPSGDSDGAATFVKSLTIPLPVADPNNLGTNGIDVSVGKVNLPGQGGNEILYGRSEDSGIPQLTVSTDLGASASVLPGPHPTPSKSQCSNAVNTSPQPGPFPTLQLSADWTLCVTGGSGVASLRLTRAPGSHGELTFEETYWSESS